jgi:hypothetical protein
MAGITTSGVTSGLFPALHHRAFLLFVFVFGPRQSAERYSCTMHTLLVNVVGFAGARMRFVLPPRGPNAAGPTDRLAAKRIIHRVRRT